MNATAPQTSEAPDIKENSASPTVTPGATSQPGPSLLEKRKFDPAKFAVDADGNPRLDSLGRYINKNAGRKKSVDSSPPDSSPPPDFSDVKNVLKFAPSDDSPSPEKLADAVAAAGDSPTAETVIGIIQTALMLLGEEEGILTAPEKDIVRRPLVRVLEKYNVGKDVMPPEVDLIFALVVLFVARLQRPKTATKWVKFRTWAAGKFFNAKGRALASHLSREVGPVGPVA